MAWLIRGLVVLLTLLLAACPRAPFLQAPVSQPLGQAALTIEPIEGRVDFGLRSTQANIDEVANGATVALIDTSTGYTVATTVTQPDGRFSLKFSAGYKAPLDQVMYLEAIKGLKAGLDMPNRVGSDLARVRTLVSFRSQTRAWTSITGTIAAIDPTTTALCTILSLRSMTPEADNRRIPPVSLLNTISAVSASPTVMDVFVNPDPALIPPEMVTQTFELVSTLLRDDADPLRNISLDTGDAQYNTLARVPRLPSVGAIVPNAQFPGQPVDIIGAAFSATASENVVEFTNVSGGPVPATVTNVSSDGSRLTVTVPDGAVTGPVAVTLNGRKMIGPTFYLALQSGHEAIDTTGNLYVANESFGTIAKITPQGQVTTFASGLVYPRALTLRNGKLYVTCASTKRGVVVVDLANPTAAATNYGTQGVILDPRGIAFDGAGALYVSDGANAKLYRIDSSTSAPVAVSLSGVALSQPRGIAFGSDGQLYVANYGANNVLAINTGTGVATLFKEGMSAPWGVSFDSLGNLYIANNTGNSIYRWHKQSGNLAPYATVPSPGGLVTDRAGYLYAVDNTSNNLYRITPLGDSSIFASGISSPTGLVKVGSTLYVLSSTNNSLMTIDTTTSALSILARGFNDPYGLAYDSTRDCFYVSNRGNGAIVRVARTTGAAATVLTGVPNAAGIAYLNNRLYLRAGASVRSYDVTDFAAPTTAWSSVMTTNLGVAKDTSTSANTGSYYIATGSGQRILRIVGDGQDLNSANASNRMVVFKEGDPNLTNPRDVAVDASGNLWVVNQVSGAGSLVAYKPNGALHLGPITSGINNPLGVGFDGSKIWVANYDAKTVTSYDTTTGLLIDTIPTTHNPRNLCFFGGDMYLVTVSGVAKIASYASTPAYSLIYAPRTGCNDIAVRSDGALYVSNGSIYRIASNLSSDVTDYLNGNSPNFFWLDGSDELWVTDSLRFARRGGGSNGYRLISAANAPGNGGAYLAGVDINGNIYLNGNSQCGKDVVARLKPGPPQEEWTYSVSGPSCAEPRVGSLAFDTLGNVYMSSFGGCGVKRVDAAGNWVDLSGISLSSTIRNGGSWVEPDGTAIYQSVITHHRIDRVSISGTSGTRATQTYGLSAAEM